jgi:hypothetical protein
MGFRNNATKGVPTGDEPETLYMVTSGTHYNGGCCFDYGNAEVGLYPNTTNNLTYAKGLMECVYFGDGYGVQGPHVLADLEMGVYGGATGHNASYAAINASFVTAMVKGDSNNHWAIKWGDAQAGPLHTAFDGPRPSPRDYSPMKKPGGLILGMGGDTSPGGEGTFYEGVVTRGYSSEEADEAVQANIVAARYGAGPVPPPLKADDPAATRRMEGEASSPTKTPQHNPLPIEQTPRWKKRGAAEPHRAAEATLEGMPASARERVKAHQERLHGQTLKKDFNHMKNLKDLKDLKDSKNAKDLGFYAAAMGTAHRERLHGRDGKAFHRPSATQDL